MKIQNTSEYNSALNEIKSWLKEGIFNNDSYTQISSVIEAVEEYMGIPLPAKGFIQSNCESN